MTFFGVLNDISVIFVENSVSVSMSQDKDGCSRTFIGSLSNRLTTFACRAIIPAVCLWRAKWIQSVAVKFRGDVLRAQRGGRTSGDHSALQMLPL